MSKHIILGIIAILFFGSMFSMAEENESCRRLIGVETDLIPFLTGGYYGSFMYGEDAWRLRFINSRVFLPEFARDDGFEEHRANIYAVIFDYFLGGSEANFGGWWLGFGYEFWQNRVTPEGSIETASWDNHLLTVGSGYTFRLTDNLTLTPWVAAHAVIGGETEIETARLTYEVNSLLAEASLKLGFRF